MNLKLKERLLFTGAILFALSAMAFMILQSVNDQKRIFDILFWVCMNASVILNGLGKNTNTNMKSRNLFFFIYILLILDMLFYMLINIVGV